MTFLGPSKTRAHTPNGEALLSRAQSLVPMAVAAADTVEASRALPEPLIRSLLDAGFFRMFIPQALGGSEVDPIVASRVIETLAAADGSIGWCAMIGAQSAWLSALLPVAGAERIVRDSRAILAGHLQPRGRAVPVDGGYRVTGHWAYASGCQHATWLYGCCTVVDGDAANRTGGRSPEFRVLFFPAADAEIIDTWHTTGLRGTGSHDIQVSELFVPHEHSLRFGPFEQSPHPGPLYRGPLINLIFVCQAGHALGVARAAVDAFVALAAGKTRWGTRSVLRDQAPVQIQVARAEALLGSARAYLNEATSDVRQTLVAGDAPSLLQRTHLRLAITHAISSAVEVVDLMYTAGGGEAIYARSALDRHFRDIHTAAAHIQAAPRIYEVTGQVFLGLEPPPGPASP